MLKFFNSKNATTPPLFFIYLTNELEQLKAQNQEL